MTDHMEPTMRLRWVTQPWPLSGPWNWFAGLNVPENFRIDYIPDELGRWADDGGEWRDVPVEEE